MTLGTDRLAWHATESAAQDVRMSGWNSAKAAEARRDMTAAQLFTAGPRGLRQLGHHDLAARLDLPWIEAIEALRAGESERAAALRRRALIEATGWDDCKCGRVFKPGERAYRTCFICSQMQNSAGRPSCAICGRRHSTSFGSCFLCKSYGLEDQAIHIRSVTSRRDAFTCAMCGGTEGAMEVDHILPVGPLGGSAQPWNVQVLCTLCQIQKGKRYGPLDELARLELMLLYDTHLSQFLFADEQDALRRDLDDTLGGYLFSPSAILPKYNHRPPECDELEGLLAVIHAFDRPPTTHITHDEPAGADLSSPTATSTPAPDACKGEVILSTGARPCRNRADFAVGILCPGPCA